MPMDPLAHLRPGNSVLYMGFACVYELLHEVLGDVVRRDRELHAEVHKRRRTPCKALNYRAAGVPRDPLAYNYAKLCLIWLTKDRSCYKMVVKLALNRWRITKGGT